FGPMLIGVLLNTTLYGVCVPILSTFPRIKSLSRDRLWFRMLVLYLVVVETANVLCDIGLIYEPLIIRYATPQALMVSPIRDESNALIVPKLNLSLTYEINQVLVSTPIQLFIAWRVRIVTRSAMLPILISVLAMVSFGGGIAVTTIVSLHPNFSDFPSFKPEVITWLVSTSACDVLLTGSLVYSLWIRKTSVIATDSYLNKIIRLTVQTGFITAAAALLDMFLYIFMPGTTLNFIFDYPLSKLYTNALLSTYVLRIIL
ncbi:hypothetical protein B0H13DRAFT_1632580, partial [Mycena leptocephala]